MMRKKLTTTLIAILLLLIISEAWALQIERPDFNVSIDRIRNSSTNGEASAGLGVG